MKSWWVNVQLNGDEVSKFYDIEFEVSEKLYAKMQTAIKRGIPLVDCPFYGELEKKAYAAAEAQINEELREEYYGERPERGDFDTRAEYLEELEEYLSSGDIDNYYIMAFDIYDPGYKTNFKSKFVGKTCPGHATGEVHTEDFEYEEYDEICANYYLTVHFDENGTITDITDITGEALESESVTSSSWGNCEPNYDLIARKLTEELFDEADGNEE